MPPPSDEFDWDAFSKGVLGSGALAPQDRRLRQLHDRYAQSLGVTVDDPERQEGSGEDSEASPSSAEAAQAEQSGRAALSYEAYRRRIGHAAMAGGRAVGGETGEVMTEVGEVLAGLDEDGKPGFAHRRWAKKKGEKAEGLYKKKARESLLKKRFTEEGLLKPEGQKALDRIALQGAALSGAVAGALRGENMREIALSAAGSVLKNRRAKWVLMVIKGGSAITLYGIVITWATIAIQMYFGNYKKTKWCPKIKWWPEGLVWAVISFIVLLILIFLALAGFLLVDMMICVGTFTPTGILSSLLNGNMENLECAKKYIELGGAVIRELFNYLDTLL